MGRSPRVHDRIHIFSYLIPVMPADGLVPPEPRFSAVYTEILAQVEPWIGLVRMLPETIAHYRIRHRLREGGAGDVFLADDLKAKRPVVLKTLTVSGLPRGEGRDRLLRDARAAAALDHPNLCPIYEIGTDRDLTFIAVEFVEGETLAARLKRGPISPLQALQIVEQAVDALAVAHGQGLVHGEIHPRNVMLTPSGQVKVLGLGLQMSCAASGSLDSEATDSDGSDVALAAYQSPEQVQKRHLDARSDLFAVGSVVYECLTGRRAFPGTSPARVRADVVDRDPPRPSDVNPALTSVHDQLCAQLLTKDPEERVQSSNELRRLLRLAIESSRVRLLGPRVRSAAPEPTPGVSMLPARVSMKVVAAAVSVALLGALAYMGMQSLWAPPLPPPTPEARRLYNQGVEALHQGAFATAAASLGAAIDAHPEFPLAHARLAQAHERLGDPQQAGGALSKARGLVPDRSRFDPEEMLYLDAIDGVVGRDFEAAIAAYSQLQAEDPTRAEIQFELGHVYEDDAQMTAALAHYERAIGLNPLFAPPFVRRGVLLGRQGVIDDAIGSLERAERLYQAAGE